MNRYALILVLFVVAGLPAWFVASAPGHGLPAAAGHTRPDVPDAVREAAEAGRYWRASRLMGDYLATLPDTTSSMLLYAARLEAGWGDWEAVGRLLEGRAWLDEEAQGAGWELLGRSRIAAGRPEAGVEALDRYAELHDLPDPERGLVELRRGLALAEAGAAADAQEAFDRAARFIPWFSDWSALLAAEAAAAAGDTAAVRERLAGAGDLAADRAWRLRMEAALEAGDSVAAREVALATARGSDGLRRATAWAELGRLRLLADDTARARSAFERALGARNTIAAVDAARALSELDPSPEEWRVIADVYAHHGNFARAARGYEAYLRSGAGTATEHEAVRLELGRARYESGQFQAAERTLLDLAEEADSPRVGAAALYLAGRAQYRQGRSDAGQRTLARLPERFPGQPSVTEGLYLLADLKHDDLEIADARRYYREAAEASPASYEAGLALMRLGGLALLEEDYDEAAAIFEEYRGMHPDGRRWAQSTYWAARAYDALGRDAEAAARLRELRESDPLSYYGVRAAELLDEPVLAIPMAEPPARDSAAGERVAAGMRRVDVLAGLDRRDDLVREVERLRSELESSPAAAYALAEALNDRGYTLSAIGMGWELHRLTGDWNERLLRIIYPFPFRDLVIPESQERGVDPHLVAGLIRRESAFNPTVTSGAGAVGLMQIMPQTGRALARAAGLDDYETGLLKQPEVNVHLGTRYFATMLDRFNGDLPLVLSAYNAGPT
ncbi:MAG: transglycosylase SLT domain-containing protein, partial [Gemmatimonadota bacterium]